MRKLGFAGAALLLSGAALLLPGIAHAQNSNLVSDCSQGPCTDSGGSSDPTPRPGETVTFSYNGGQYLPGSSGNIDILSTPQNLGTFTADGNGNFSVRVKLPTNLSGFHTLRAVGTSRFGTRLTVTSTIDIEGAPLTATGTNTMPWVLVGLGTVMVGATGVGFARKRSHK